MMMMEDDSCDDVLHPYYYKILPKLIQYMSIEYIFKLNYSILNNGKDLDIVEMIMSTPYKPRPFVIFKSLCSVVNEIGLCFFDRCPGVCKRFRHTSYLIYFFNKLKITLDCYNMDRIMHAFDIKNFDSMELDVKLVIMKSKYAKFEIIKILIDSMKLAETSWRHKCTTLRHVVKIFLPIDRNNLDLVDINGCMKKDVYEYFKNDMPLSIEHLASETHMADYMHRTCRVNHLEKFKVCGTDTRHLQQIICYLVSKLGYSVGEIRNLEEYRKIRSRHPSICIYSYLDIPRFVSDVFTDPNTDFVSLKDETQIATLSGYQLLKALVSYRWNWDTLYKFINRCCTHDSDLEFNMTYVLKGLRYMAIVKLEDGSKMCFPIEKLTVQNYSDEEMRTLFEMWMYKNDRMNRLFGDVQKQNHISGSPEQKTNPFYLMSGFNGRLNMFIIKYRTEHRCEDREIDFGEYDFYSTSIEDFV